MRSLFHIVRPLLHSLDGETVHRLTIRGLSYLPPRSTPPDDSLTAVSVLGHRFPNPVGLAAGFDKGAEAPDVLLRLGFGFVEVGGVVPRPQPGNPRPRVFRLTKDQAVINRFGLNSEGLETVSRRLAARSHRPGIVGVNIGANKESKDRLTDYVTCTRGLAGLVDFITVNVSSPNTPGLRDLQGEAFLDDLLARVIEARNEAPSPRRTGLLLKIAPDITLEALDVIVETAMRRGLDGLVVSNTTISRPMTLIDSAIAREVGGLSGRPLFSPSTRLLAETFLRVGRRMPLIGVGGVDSADAAWTKIRAGASLIQLYSALIFEGIGLVSEIKAGLVAQVARSSRPLQDMVGSDAAELARSA